MKILITLSYYLPNISGLTNYAKNLSEGLVEKKHGVTILSSRYNKNLPKEEILNNINIKRSWTPFVIGRGPLMPIYIIDAYKNIQQADIVNIHLPQFEGFVTSTIAKLIGKKLIITYHCDLSFWGGPLNIISTVLVYLSNFISCFMAERIVVNSKDYADSSWFLEIFKKKLVYIYPPVKIGKAGSGVLKKFENVKYKIGYVGRISKEKGVVYLLESIKYLKEKIDSFRVFFVGPADDIVGGSQRIEISKLLTRYKDNIVEMGKLPENKLYGFYKEIDCLVLPSVEGQESFGMVQIEAILSGCPVVVSDLRGIRIPVQITKMGKTFSAKDPEDLAITLSDVLKNKSAYKNNNRKGVLSDFKYRGSVSAYEKMFKLLLKTK